jgi:hypothetical protein
VGRPRNRCEDVIQRDAAKLLRILNWKVAARSESGGRRLGRPWPESGPERHRRSIYRISVLGYPGWKNITNINSLKPNIV